MSPFAPLTPFRPLTPLVPPVAFFEITFCTWGESLSNVMAPFAMFAVWMRPVASAVPPAMATNAIAAQASTSLVRMS